MSATLKINAPLGVTAVKAFTPDTDTVIATASSVTAGSNDASFYTVVFATLADGRYRIVFYESTTAVASEDVSVNSEVFSITGPSVIVHPLAGVVSNRINGTYIGLFVGETSSVSIGVVDSSGTAVDVSAMNLAIVFEDRNSRTDVATVANGSITKSTSTVIFTVPTAVTTIERSLIWSLRNTTDVLLHGVCEVTYAAKAD